MFKKIMSIIGAILGILVALYLFLHGSTIVGALFLIASGRSIYNTFFVAPIAPLPVFATKFEDIKNAVTERGAVGLFVGKISELEKSAKWNTFATEVVQAETQLLNAMGGRSMGSGNALLDVGLNMGMRAGLNRAVLSTTDVIVAQFSDGTHLSTILSGGVTREVSDFLISSQAAGIPVEGNTKKAPMIGRPFLIGLAIVVALAVVFILFAAGK